MPTLVLATATAGASTIYWTDFAADGTGGISRADLDILDVEILISTGLSPYRIAIDQIGQKMYWTDMAGVLRANLDGSNLEAIAPGFYPALGIAVDGGSGKVYWTLGDDVWWANLDGS